MEVKSTIMDSTRGSRSCACSNADTVISLVDLLCWEVVEHVESRIGADALFERNFYTGVSGWDLM